ncbi:hypothetical protein STEG23_023440, partial [Scotinomys teguina]
NFLQNVLREHFGIFNFFGLIRWRDRFTTITQGTGDVDLRLELVFQTWFHNLWSLLELATLLQGYPELYNMFTLAESYD